MSTPVHAHFSEWDAAYVLGSLSPADRREFEEHLDECERCRDAVAELSGMPGLLGRLDDARAFALLEQTAPVAGAGSAGATAASGALVARIDSRRRRERVRRTALGVGALAAAAALASALTIAIPAALAPAPAQADAFSSLSAPAGQQLPIEVTVELTSTSWGTRLEMDCRYRVSTDPDAGYGTSDYALWVRGTDGSEQQVSTWTSAPGSEVVLDAGTAFPLDDIDQLDLRTADGLVLMSGEITPNDRDG